MSHLNYAMTAAYDEGRHVSSEVIFPV